MFGIVVLARDEGVQAASQPVDGRVERGIIVVGEDDVEVAVELGGGKLVKVLGHEGEAD